MTDDVHHWREIEQISEAVLAHPAAEREALLHRACGDDADLRRRVEAVIAQVSRAERFLEQPIAAVSALLLDLEPDALLTGSRVGTLTIGPLIGSGGMGRVYRAHDSGQDRDVALKVLLPEHAADADRLARFAREARLLATVRHDNIAQIYGVTEVPGGTAIVMELVEGETLAERIESGPIAWRDLLPIARQVAQALEVAHKHHVIHRDLKPANIKIAPDGTVKVLDFGLAKSLRLDSATPAGQSSGVRSTISGLVLGTIAYMSPEQVRGAALDRRVDLWALGCVLFEMLTAQPAFGGRTPSDSMVRIIEHAPAWSALPQSTPPALRRLLRRCLEKDAVQRLDSAAVARIEIAEAEAELDGVAAGDGPVAVRQPARPWRWLAFGAVAGVGAALALTTLFPAATASPVVAMTIQAHGARVRTPGVHFAVAPDGQSVVYPTNIGGQEILMRRDIDRIDPVPIVGTTNGSDVFFSPDGRSIGFEAASGLWTAPLEDGAARRLLSNQPLRGASWGSDGRIVMAIVGSGLWMSSVAGIEPVRLTTPDSGARHELPQMLPGGRAVLFTILSATATARAAIVSLETGETTELLEGIAARFVDSGHLLFGRQGRLWAVAFDPVSLRTSGTARPVLDDVFWSPTGYPQFAIDGGLLAYVRASRGSQTYGRVRIAIATRRGTKSVVSLPGDNYSLPRFSRSGGRFVVQVGPIRDLWAYDLGRGTFTRLTSGRIVAFSAPAWTPDERRVVFTTWFGREVGLATVPSDGSGPVEALVHGVGMRSFERTHPALLPDGSAAILTGLAPGATVEDLLLVHWHKEPRLETLLSEPAIERNVAVSPNGRFIAYNSDESGRPEVYVRPFPAVGTRRWQVSSVGGAYPFWTKGGRELLYVDGQRRIVSTILEPTTAGDLGIVKAEPLFMTDCRIGLGLDRCFDATPDGERFLLLVDETEQPGGEPLELILIQNWGKELTRLMRP